jgi:hypothetical protein
MGAVSLKVVDDSSYRIVLSDDAIPVMDHVLSYISFDDNPTSGMDIDIIIPSDANASLDDVEDKPSGADASLDDVEDKPSGADASLEEVEDNPSGADASFDDVVNGSGTINDVSFDDAVVEDSKPSTVDDRTSNARR